MSIHALLLAAVLAVGGEESDQRIREAGDDVDRLWEVTQALASAEDETLLRALRRVGYVEVKLSCEGGDCGACAVLLDGVAVNACLMFAAQADGGRRGQVAVLDEATRLIEGELEATDEES